MAMIKWILTTAEKYAGLSVKDNNALYFLEDTREIYRGELEYTNSVNIVEELPNFAAKGKLYILSDTLEGKVYNGSEWKTVIPSISDVLTDEAVENGVVTGEAIKDYVTKKIADMTSGMVTELDTDKVTLTTRIPVIGQTLGSYKDGDFIEAGETLTTILKKQFAKQIPPTYSTPSFSMTPSNQSVESGTLVNPTVNGTFTKRDAGDVTEYKLVRLYNGNSETVLTKATIEQYMQPEITVEDGGNLKFTGTVNYAQGPVKNDNLGLPYPTGQIKAGTLSQTITYTGQRKAFYGRDNQSEAAAESSEIRSLPQNVLNPVNGTKLTISIQSGDSRVTFAYPAALRDVTSVMSSALNLNVKDTFQKTLVDVEGANGYKATQYKVYTYIPAIPFATSDTYTITI